MPESSSRDFTCRLLGDGSESAILIENGITVLGRGDLLGITDKHVSRSIAKLEFSARYGELKVQALHKKHATSVKCARDPPRLLAPGGDIVTVDNGDFVYLCGERFRFKVQLTRPRVASRASAHSGDEDMGRGEAKRDAAAPAATTALDAELARQMRPLCRFGNTCYRKNKRHMQTYRHDEAPKAADDSPALPRQPSISSLFKEQKAKVPFGPTSRYHLLVLPLMAGPGLIDDDDETMVLCEAIFGFLNEFKFAPVRILVVGPPSTEVSTFWSNWRGGCKDPRVRAFTDSPFGLSWDWGSGEKGFPFLPPPEDAALDWSKAPKPMSVTLANPATLKFSRKGSEVNEWLHSVCPEALRNAKFYGDAQIGAAYPINSPATSYMSVMKVDRIIHVLAPSSNPKHPNHVPQELARETLLSCLKGTLEHFFSLSLPELVGEVRAEQRKKGRRFREGSPGTRRRIAAGDSEDDDSDSDSPAPHTPPRRSVYSDPRSWRKRVIQEVFDAVEGGLYKTDAGTVVKLPVQEMVAGVAQTHICDGTPCELAKQGQAKAKPRPAAAAPKVPQSGAGTGAGAGSGKPAKKKAKKASLVHSQTTILNFFGTKGSGAGDTEGGEEEAATPVVPLQPIKRRLRNVVVVNQDCLAAALEVQAAGFSPVVLNMANAFRAGGGFRTGAGAQEENLHRRSNLFQHLENPECLPRARPFTYPLPEFSTVYSPKVCVFRGTEDAGYPWLDAPVWMAFIAAAAYSHPRKRAGRLTEEVAGKTARKIEAIVRTALCHGHDVLVLGAFGCGAFANPPRHVAEIFREVLRDYAHEFRYIVFPILEDHNSRQSHNPHGNSQPFADVFRTKVLDEAAFTGTVASWSTS